MVIKNGNAKGTHHPRNVANHVEYVILAIVIV